ncbi:MFS transporter [Alteromonas alba]|uniref:MFS transporter n=1 Tax=Alteromonas alba TaxID=2079529 RepID=A0A2S9VAR9_9ALTE|nr:MFS transporter [Alteromonas alba]MCP4864242.1 MFS transporter [Alteromonas sp.]PRO73405.1 MFS transporter [Alteromonas alba]|tara:strand:- start:1676 stop:2878 length:1203 start_codon:yes stop_codon:yes gene_type:complete
MTQSSVFTSRFVWFLFGRGIFSAIESIMAVAFAWHLYERTGDPFDLALVGLFQIVPVYLLFPITGWAVDHISRSKILLAGATMQLAVLSGFALLMMTPDFNKWFLLALISLHGCGKAFMSPALQATLPNLVPPHHLNQAVAITSTVWNIALTVGPFVAGILIALLDRNIYWLLVAAAIATLTCFYQIPTMGAANTGKGKRDLLGGLRYVWQNQIVLGSLSLDLLIVLSGSVVALLPVYAADILNVGPEGLGFLRAMPAAGAVLMGIYLSRFKTEFENTGTTLFVSLSVFALSIITFALSETLWLAACALFIYGASDMISVVIRGAVVQLNTPDAFRGRVSAANSIFIASSNQLGDFRAGAVAAAMGPVGATLLGGACAMAVTAGGAYWFKDLRRLKKIEN